MCQSQDVISNAQVGREWLFIVPMLARERKLTSVPAMSLPLHITAVQPAIQSLRTQLPPQDSHS